MGSSNSSSRNASIEFSKSISISISASGISKGVEGSRSSGTSLCQTRARICAVTIASFSGVCSIKSWMLWICGKFFLTSKGVILARSVTCPLPPSNASISFRQVDLYLQTVQPIFPDELTEITPDFLVKSSFSICDSRTTSRAAAYCWSYSLKNDSWVLPDPVTTSPIRAQTQLSKSRPIIPTQRSSPSIPSAWKCLV